MSEEKIERVRKKFDGTNSFVFSYSSLSLFEQCPQAFKLHYIDNVQSAGNYFADVGSFSHLIFEKMFGGDIESFEMSTYFKTHYYDKGVINVDPPPVITGMEANYYKQLLECFENPILDNVDYTVYCIEEEYKYENDGIKFVVKPDLIIYDKKTNDIILFDYKTSKYDSSKHAKYGTQLSLYKIIIEEVKGIQIKEMNIYYLRENKIRKLKFQSDVLNWAVYTAKKVLEEEEWTAKPEKFYCDWLCSCRNSCKFRKE